MSIATEVKARARKGPIPVYMRCELDAKGQGILRPADRASQELLRAKKIRVGMVYACQIKQIRNPGFHKKIHSLMRALIENVAAFESYDPIRDQHRALKRVQLEARLACDEVMIDGGFICFIPRSFNFDDMPEDEFAGVYKQVMDYIAKKYWPEMSELQIEELAAFAEESH
ncbi:hypothetical protein [Nevskia ramosa]|uniref:hypothetical protein n=1 Tax=Nevskia ramosa TaxID=64002 RepID=UPI003D11ADE0